MGYFFDKRGSNIIFFGGYNDNDDFNLLGGFISSYDLLMSQFLVLSLDILNQKDFVVLDINGIKNIV